ncbi:hypothetical protein [Psychromonas algicola]|uniref:hypothetical protein n=1 Tax=Psychromonas algicola TaxID=2555642 RepID=UPI00106790EF|nr:hypothetical protein [Psychromonas sp. RZ5]TEW50160.1 hypothetical protein E2R67_09855 [Psychromonas sp. RZ5]
MELEQYFHQGRITLEIVPHEMKMSHWVYAPTLTDTLSDHCYFNLTNKVWDLISAKEDESSITLLLRKYSKDLQEYEIQIFIDKNEALINGKAISVFEIDTFLNHSA